MSIVSGEQLNKEVFISLGGLKTIARGLTVQTQQIHAPQVSKTEFLWSIVVYRTQHENSEKTKDLMCFME